jgi:hypothetical protein
LTGWLRDLDPEHDTGAFQWGGVQSVPRELYAGPEGQIYSRPVVEAFAPFTRTVLDLARNPEPYRQSVRWDYGDAGLIGRAEGGPSQCGFAVPADYLLECRLSLREKAVFTLVMREQEAFGAGYRLTINPYPAGCKPLVHRAGICAGDDDRMLYQRRLCVQLSRLRPSFRTPRPERLWRPSGSLFVDREDTGMKDLGRQTKGEG